MLTPDCDIDRRILLEAQSLIDDGWKVTVVAMPSTDPTRADPIWVRRVELYAGTVTREQCVMKCYGWLRSRIPMNGAIMKALKALVWRKVVDPETFYARMFAAAIAEDRPDVVVAHDLPMLPLAHQKAIAAGAKLILDSHELWCEQAFPESWKRGWRAVEQRHIRACDMVITVNQSIAHALQTTYALSRVEVIANATVPETSKPRSLREACALADDAMILLYQGGLVSGRQLEMCIDAIALVRNPRVHLVLLGGGALRAGLINRSIRARSKARVHFLDPVPQRELLSWTESADAGIIPYGAQCENNRLCTPNKLYEFIAARTPILANDLPELRAMVQGNGFGMVCALTDPMRTAEAIDELFADSARLARWRKSLVEQGSRFEWPAEARRYQAMFRTLFPSDSGKDLQ